MVELAASAGLLLDPWQGHDLDVGLGEGPGGRWAAFEVGLIAPRQNGKDAILEALELAGLYLFDDDRLILHSAHEFKTAQEAFLRVLALIEGTADLSRRVARVRTSHGEEGIELTNGRRLRFVARSRHSGRGFTGDRVILNEAYNLSDKTLAALLPTMSARSVSGNPQLWYVSSAPLDTPESAVLRRLCRRGRKGSPGLAYIEYSAEPGTDLDDREAWRKANPSFGVRISESFVEAERGAMSDEDFARERLGIWRDVDEDHAWLVVPEAKWQACANPQSRITGPRSFAVDVTPARDHASIAVAGTNRHGVAHRELVDHRRGSGWVVERIVELVEKWAPVHVVVDKGAAAGSLVGELEAVEVPLLEVGTSELKQACGQFYDDVVDGDMAHLGEPVLTAAVAGAAKRKIGEAWAWDRYVPGGSALTAVTLAAWGHAQPDGRASVYESRGLVAT